jgi:hypothetical protein
MAIKRSRQKRSHGGSGSRGVDQIMAMARKDRNARSCTSSMLRLMVYYRYPAPKHVPHQNTLKSRPPPPPKCAISSSNQVVSTRLLLQFEEGSSLIMPMQLGSSSATVALSLDGSVASLSPRSKQTHSGTNVLPLSKRRS